MLRKFLNVELILCLVLTSRHVVFCQDDAAAPEGDPAPAADPKPADQAPPKPDDKQDATAPKVDAGPKPNRTLVFDENQSEEGPEVKEALVKMEKLHCDTMFVDCMEHMSNLHRHTKKERIEASCLRQTLGFLICGQYTEKDAQEAPKNVEIANSTPVPLSTPAPHES